MTTITGRESGAGRGGERERQDAGRVHPRVLAPGVELGALGRGIRGGRLRAGPPGWPDDPETVEEARKNPQVLAGKGVGQVADHFAEVIGRLDRKPAIVGHSFGGLLAQILAGRGLSAATVAVDPAPFRGVLPLPIAAIRSTLPVLANPPTAAAPSPSPSTSSVTAGRTGSTRRRRAGLRALPRRRPGQADLPGGPRQLQPRLGDPRRHPHPDRGPLLLFTGGVDHAVPPAMSRAAFKKQGATRASPSTSSCPTAATRW